MPITLAHAKELERQWYIRLRENEIDLQMELNDLGDEIRTRMERIAEVNDLLRETRATLTALRHAAA